MTLQYTCSAGHQQSASGALTKCQAYRLGKPCTAPLKRIGPGSKSASGHR